jgi:IS605 OrfB family transposase
VLAAYNATTKSQCWSYKDRYMILSAALCWAPACDYIIVNSLNSLAVLTIALGEHLMPQPDPTTRAYTLKLSGEGNWRDELWKTHVAVNRGAQAWGDWLLTLRGGLPATLADEHPERRILLALSWLSVESPKTLVPTKYIIRDSICEHFRTLLDRLEIENQDAWIAACTPALTARIREDAVWIDRSACFVELQQQFAGLNSDWASTTLFGLLGGVEDYFAMPDADAPVATEGKDFVQKAGGWLSRNWGGGKKSDSSAIGSCLNRLANIEPRCIVGASGKTAIGSLFSALGHVPSSDADAAELFRQLKQVVGWKGRPSKGALALEKLHEADSVSAELWQRTVSKLKEESAEQSAKGQNAEARPEWMDDWRKQMEARLGMPYRTSKDLIWEHGVTLDHALRRVSAGHTWIKRAEADRCRFREDAAKIAAVPTIAREWLDTFCDARTEEGGALDEYIIRKRAIDGWEKIVDAWADLGKSSTRMQRILAAREVQNNLDDNDKFGDIQLFAGFGDENDDEPRSCLADEAARCVWWDAGGTPTAAILRSYVEATVAQHNQRRFKVPAYRHPDPLRNPIYVDFGNSRWGISYSALKVVQQRQKWTEQLSSAKTDKARSILREQLDAPADVRRVSLDVWNGKEVGPLSLRWQGKRLWNDLDLDHWSDSRSASTVSRADRLGRIVAGQTQEAAVKIAEVFEQQNWNGRLQVPRNQLDRLADYVYGKVGAKRVPPDYSMLDGLFDIRHASELWQRLDWFITTSAKLQPHGPWLDYARPVSQGGKLADGIEYKKGRNGNYLDYTENKARKGRARLLLARLPGLRILSLDLGHRYAAACAVWETLSSQQMVEDCQAAGHTAPRGSDLYLQLKRKTDKLQKSGGKKGQPVVETTVYRRIAADKLPDGSLHPAPWARLERQFLIRLQGEDRPARVPRPDEIAAINLFREFLGTPSIVDSKRIDELQKETLRDARLGLRRFGDAARIAFAMTTTRKPIAGGRELELTPSQRRQYLQDNLALWHQLAGSQRDAWAAQLWEQWVVQRLGGPKVVNIGDDLTRPEQKRRNKTIREQLFAVAEQLADPQSGNAIELQRLWSEEWSKREAEWKTHLRWLRRFILPRSKDWRTHGKETRRVGGLSVQRLQNIRNLYQVLKAFRMRPTPENLRANVPQSGDESLANFGRRILDQLDRLREQRIKQLASRVVEAALGAGRMKRSERHDIQRPQARRDRACHAVVIENLEHYRPEETRLRRDNRQLMDWAARNVRKHIVEGCQLHGLHFVEVMPAYTSKLDSRTGSPGIRCEDISRKVLEEAVRLADPAENHQSTGAASDRNVLRWARDLRRVRKLKQDGKTDELSPRDQVLIDIADALSRLPANRQTIRLPRRGGEVFVSADPASAAKNGLQADLNAAANIGLKAVMDPDWDGCWAFVLVDAVTGQPVSEKVQGSAVWSSQRALLPPDSSGTESGKQGKPGVKKRTRKTGGYAWKPTAGIGNGQYWIPTTAYWNAVEKKVADYLRNSQIPPDSPF